MAKASCIWTVPAMALALGLAGCVGGPDVDVAERPADEALDATQPEPARQPGILVDAMPVSMGPPTETIPGERVYVVTVQLQHGGRPVAFYPGQEFAVQYEVYQRTTKVVNDRVVLPTSPRFVVPKGPQASAFKFLVQTTKAPGPEYTLRVLVNYSNVQGRSDPVAITQ